MSTLRRSVRLPVLVAVVAMIVAACGGNGDDVAGDGGETTPANDGAGGETEAMDAWEPEYEDGVLQPLPSGFPEQPITLLNVDEPGSDDGLYARTMQGALADISPVDIQVQDRPSATYGTWEGLNFVMSQEGGPEGYMPMVAAMTGAPLDVLMVPVEADTGLGADDWNPVIATERSPFVLATRTDAPWGTSYEDMAAYARDNPGELRYAARVGSQLDVAMSRLMAEGGYDAETLPVGDLDEAGTVLGAGEADFSMLLPGTAQAHYDAGRLEVILSVGAAVPETWQDTAVTTADIGLPDEPWGSIRGFIIPPDAPDEHRAWLYELFRKATETEVYQERISNLPGGELITHDHDELIEVMDNVLDFADPILRDLELHVEQQ